MVMRCDVMQALGCEPEAVAPPSPSAGTELAQLCRSRGQRGAELGAQQQAAAGRGRHGRSPTRCRLPVGHMPPRRPRLRPCTTRARLGLSVAKAGESGAEAPLGPRAVAPCSVPAVPPSTGLSVGTATPRGRLCASPGFPGWWQCQRAELRAGRALSPRWGPSTAGVGGQGRGRAPGSGSCSAQPCPCCRGRWVSRCALPIAEKPGTCPPVKPGIPMLGLCVNQCKTDSNCPGSLKCCRNGCGKVSCVTPFY